MTEDDRGLDVHLPPLRLPSFLPPAFELPVPGDPGGGPASTTRALALGVAIDAVGGTLAVVAERPVVLATTVVTLLLALVLAGLVGSLVAWEPVVTLAGGPLWTVFPSATVAVVIRALVSAEDSDSARSPGE
ncbi:MAG: hypothetical protein ABEJ77_02920 [Halanaeroarchaeum sp.]